MVVQTLKFQKSKLFVDTTLARFPQYTNSYSTLMDSRNIDPHLLAVTRQVNYKHPGTLFDLCVHIGTKQITSKPTLVYICVGYSILPFIWTVTTVCFSLLWKQHVAVSTSGLYWDHSKTGLNQIRTECFCWLGLVCFSLFTVGCLLFCEAVSSPASCDLNCVMLHRREKTAGKCSYHGQMN